MSKTSENNKVLLPNMLLIAGNGRNVGKTYLACRLIRHFAASGKVTGVKITPHFHEVNNENVIMQNEFFCILEEKERTHKDSSLMLQAGADRVFFVMAERDRLEEAFQALLPLLPNHPIVCESGGLHEFVHPGLFFFVNMKDREIKKTQHLEHQPVMVINNGNEFSIDIRNVHPTEQGFIFEA